MIHKRPNIGKISLKKGSILGNSGLSLSIVQCSLLVAHAWNKIVVSGLDKNCRTGTCAFCALDLRSYYSSRLRSCNQIKMLISAMHDFCQQSQICVMTPSWSCHATVISSDTVVILSHKRYFPKMFTKINTLLKLGGPAQNLPRF